MLKTDVRYAIDPRGAKSLDTDGLRREFHVGCKTHSNNGPQRRLRHSAVVAE